MKALQAEIQEGKNPEHTPLPCYAGSADMTVVLEQTIVVLESMLHMFKQYCHVIGLPLMESYFNSGFRSL